MSQLLDQYSAEFKKKFVRDLQAGPNVPLQRLTQRFKSQSDSLRKQIDETTQSLEQKRKELEARLKTSVELEKRGEELKRLQQVAGELSAKMEALSASDDKINIQSDIISGDAEQAEHTRFEHFEQSLKSVEIVIAMFNDSAGYSSQLRAVHEVLTIQHHSLYTWGLKVDADSSDAKKYRVTDAPTCIVFRNGKETSRLAPIKSAEQLKQFVILAVDAKKVTVQTNGAMVAEGIESIDLSPHVAEAEEHSSNNWPAGYIFASPREAEISASAWQRLYLKLVPATPEELKAAGRSPWCAGSQLISRTVGAERQSAINSYQNQRRLAQLA